MPLPAIPERPGSLSAFGLIKEATYGVNPGAPTNWFPFKSCTLNPDVGLFYPGVIMGQRDRNIFAAYGEYKFNGNVGAPLFPVNGIPILVAAIGADGGRAAQASGNGVTGTSNSVRTGTIAASIVGATTVAYTVTTGGTPVVGDIFQFDTNSASTSAEVRRISAVSGTTSPFTLTIDPAGPALNYAHAGAAAAITVTSPYTHQILQANTLDSLTLEKVVGGYQSEIYTGARVAKYIIKLAAGNSEAEVTADFMTQNVAIQASPDPITVTNESPYVFAEGAVTLFGTQIQIPTAIELEIDNATKETYTFSGQHYPSYITPVTRKIQGKLTLVWNSLNDATYGYFNQYMQTTTGSLSFALTHPTNAGSVTLNLNKINLRKYADEIKLEDIVLIPLEFEARLDLTATPLSTITATIVEQSVYLPW